MKKKVVIIGAGPAGLTMAYTLLKKSKDYDVIIVEEDKLVGGISKTISYHDGYKMDLGGHRFFSKNKEINKLWQEILPIQAKESYEDKILNIDKHLPKKGPDPEKNDKVLLIRNRVSRIYYDKSFYDYPITIKLQVFRQLGLRTTLSCGFSYLKSIFVKKEENNLENFYINRFGKKLYSIFFEGYTEKLWGRSPKEIDSSWGRQRVKGLSIIEIIKDYFRRVLKIDNKEKETSLIESFYYPKFGPGQMWEEMAKKINKMGGNILLNSKVIKINKNKNMIQSIIIKSNDKTEVIEGDYFVSSMPIKDLIESLNNVPKGIKDIALNLPYRDFITVGLVLKQFNLRNNTKLKTLHDITPDCWIYVQGKEQKLGRIQIFNNWSPYLVKNDNYISLGLEYFCNEGDDFWNKSNEELFRYATQELISMDIINTRDDVIDFHVVKVKKAYPAYFDSYKDFSLVREYLNGITNLYCIGRNGQHRYNNMDHSMETGIKAAQIIIDKEKDKSVIWNVNTEQVYHEEGNSNEKDYSKN